MSNLQVMDLLCSRVIYAAVGYLNGLLNIM